MNKSFMALTAVAVGAVGASMAIPNLVQARKGGHQASAIGALETVATSPATFRDGDKEQDGNLDYGQLAELHNRGLVDSVLGGGTKCGTTGDRYFSTNQSGVLDFSTLPNNGAVPTGKGSAETPPPEAPPPEAPPVLAVGDGTTSTFGADVDTASYSLVRRYLDHGTLPPPELVRLEELLNRFDVTDPAPPTDGPFATRVEVAGCPWNTAHRLVRIALRGRTLPKRPPTNLVFLVDVSGSMGVPERLPLLKQALRLLVEQLGETDRVSLVSYAGAAGLVLPPTSGNQHAKILGAIDALEAGGSTNGGAGIELAYRTAIESFVDGGANRVILCTDGDFNVGIDTPEQLEKFIAAKRRTGVFLSALGFGVDATGDRIMSRLADCGNGHYAAIENVRDARRMLVKELAGTLYTIAKDVKIQVEWNPAAVRSWRLLGYEKRALAKADFTNDKKDAGEIGAGHHVTALYEVDPASPRSENLMKLRLRWKAPDSETSTGIELAASDAGASFESASSDFKFAASVAAGALLLRRSPHAGDATWAKTIRWATDARVTDERAEWLELLRRAEALAAEKTPG